MAKTIGKTFIMRITAHRCGDIRKSDRMIRFGYQIKIADYNNRLK